MTPEEVNLLQKLAEEIDLDLTHMWDPQPDSSDYKCAFCGMRPIPYEDHGRIRHASNCRAASYVRLLNKLCNKAPLAFQVQKLVEDGQPEEARALIAADRLGVDVTGTG
jgi:hypothetical protein